MTSISSVGDKWFVRKCSNVVGNAHHLRSQLCGGTGTPGNYLFQFVAWLALFLQFLILVNLSYGSCTCAAPFRQLQEKPVCVIVTESMIANLEPFLVRPNAFEELQGLLHLLGSVSVG